MVNYYIVSTCHRKGGCETKGKLFPLLVFTEKRQWHVDHVREFPFPFHVGKC